MSGTTNSISLQLEQALQLQDNAMKIADGFREAVMSSKNSISVELSNLDGSTFNIDIPTNLFLGNKLETLTKTLENLIGISTDGKTRLISTSGNKISELIVNSKNLTDVRKLTIDEIQVSSEIDVNANPVIENLLSPLPTLEFQIPNEIDTTSYLVEKIIFNNELLNIQNGVSYKDLTKKLAKSKTANKVVKTISEINPRKKRFSGSFKIVSTKINGLNIDVELDKQTYDDALSIVDGTKYLVEGDILTKVDKSITYKIVGIRDNVVTLKHIDGISSISKDELLSFVDTFSNSNITLSVPVKLNEKSVIFLTPINNVTNTCGIISDGFVFDSSNYFITSNNNEIPFNEYFSLKISDISSYFLSMLTENMIPVSLAIKPEKPTLLENNFKILQVNNHLTNSTVTDRLEKLQQEKSITENQLSVIQNTISNLNTKINSGNYATLTKRNADKSTLNVKIQERDEKSTLLSSIVNNISSTISNSSKDVFSPKYRLRGFWKLGEDTISDETRNQKIIQYEIRYRYTKLKSNVSQIDQFTYSNDGDEINAALSPWIYATTAQLTRLIRENDNSVEWGINDESSIDEININQIDIPITYGEAAEFQIRAISEAGWPTTPIKSDWSNIVRKEFGDDVPRQNTILSIIENNSKDLLKVQIENEFRNQGFTKHLSNAYTEQEKYFPHRLDEIASGKMTDEQKTISATEYLESIEKRVKALDEIVNRRYSAVSVQLIDETLTTYDINNFSTIKLFGGNYIDEVDLSVATNFGSIIQKQFFLKLTNQNIQTIEILSISPGGLTQQAMSSSYNAVPVKLNNQGFVNQKNGQIFYNRLKTVDLSNDLYVDEPKSSLTIPSSDVNTSAGISSKNIVHLTPTKAIEIVNLLPNASMESYVAMTIDHPAYINYKSSGSTIEINSIFDRIENFNQTFRQSNVQQILTSSNIYGFDQNDKYLIGKNSVGASLFVALNDFTSFQVQGVDSSSSKEIYTGSQDSIMIPIIFQYRMTDALGNVNGQKSLNSNSNFEYSKKIGFDLLINNKLFSFDVEVSAKYRSTSTANQNLNVILASNNTTVKIN